MNLYTFIFWCQSFCGTDDATLVIPNLSKEGCHRILDQRHKILNRTTAGDVVLCVEQGKDISAIIHQPKGEHVE